MSSASSQDHTSNGPSEAKIIHTDALTQLSNTIAPLALERYDSDTDIARLTDSMHEIGPQQETLKHLIGERADLLSGCSSVCPIRRLPTEILEQIFGLHRDRRFCPDLYSDDFNTQLQLLGNVQILTLAQVCKRWQEIALETPILWAVIVIHSILWTRPERTETVMNLLQSALYRSNTCLLSIVISHIPGSLHPPPALRLLCDHSEQWQAVTFFGPLTNVQGFFRFGREAAQLGDTRSYQRRGSWDPIGPFSRSAKLEGFDLRESSSTYGANGRLPTRAARKHFHLRAYGTQAALVHNPHAPPLSMQQAQHITDHPCRRRGRAFAEPVVCDISILNVAVDVRRSTDANTKPVFGKFMDSVSVSFPSLANLSLESIQRHILPWPHAHFISLSTRSSLAGHLLSLDLEPVRISVADLLEVLAALPMLERLAIAHHPQDTDERALTTDAHHATPAVACAPLFTTSLLTALVHHPVSTSSTDTAQTLVSRLANLTCESVLQLEDQVLLEFLLSRVQMRQSSDDTPFSLEVWCPPEHARPLDAAVAGRIQELRVQRRLMFVFEVIGLTDWSLVL
ncbi:hypothetical protein C8R43DRAFT_305293 [Mycena crocata]|nr:hypothetical protein C8R43DRAFT_305293 [Mycena crocata]